MQRASLILPHEVAEKVQLDLLKQAFAQFKIGLGTSFFCATVLLIGLYEKSENFILLVWYGFFLITTLVRIVVAVSSSNKITIETMNYWKKAFIMGTLFGGIGWGLTGCLLFPFVSNVKQTLIILILAGVTAGAVPLLATVRNACLAFLIPALAMVIVPIFLLGNTVYSTFDIALTGYLIYLIYLTIRTNQIMVNSVSLQYENNILLKDLSVAKNQLEYTVEHDPLTQVANRTLFEKSFKLALTRAGGANKILALLYIDLDNFKEVNDSYGHIIGDQLLVIIVNRIKKVLRLSDLIARSGGDEFTIILEDIPSTKEVITIAEKICQTVAKPVKIYDQIILISACIGISIYPYDGTDSETLLKAADKSMYFVKENGRNNFHLHTAAID